MRTENSDLRGNVCVYRETQDELTSELADFKDKYREVVDLLADAREDLRRYNKRGHHHHLRDVSGNNKGFVDSEDDRDSLIWDDKATGESLYPIVYVKVVKNDVT